MKTLFYSLCCCVLISCSSESSETADKDKKKNDSSYTIEPNHLKVKNQEDLTDAKGIVGIFFVPEMLTVTKMDSAPMSKVAISMARDFSLVEKDLERMKTKRFGSLGSIYYNSDTSNFIFECVVPIEKMPTIQPKNCQVVVLEEGKMLIYNFYGPYQELNKAYEEIKAYCIKYKLEIIGPLREFYITDATVTSNPSEWLTRIMVPVK